MTVKVKNGENCDQTDPSTLQFPRWPAVFPGPFHDGQADRSDKGLGSRLVCGSRGAVVSAALSERKVAGSIPTIADYHTVGPCKKAVFACLATDIK